MKNKKLVIGGFVLFLLLMGTHFYRHFSYIGASRESVESCLSDKNDRGETGTPCIEMRETADMAFNSATALDILIPVVMFNLFLILAAHLDKAETRIDELEKRIDASGEFLASYDD